MSGSILGPLELLLTFVVVMAFGLYELSKLRASGKASITVDADARAEDTTSTGRGQGQPESTQPAPLKGEREDQP